MVIYTTNLPYITNIINFSIQEGDFPDKLMLPEVSPIFKKWWLTQRELQACQCFTSCAKGLWINPISSNERFHDKKIIKTTGFKKKS